MIKLIGIGPGDPRYLTEINKKEIIKAEKVFAYRRVKETFKNIRDDIYLIESTKTLMEKLEDEKDAAILISGDPSFYGLLEYFKRNFKGDFEVFPGISSVSYLFSKLKLSFQDFTLLSGHGRQLDFENLDPKASFAFLTDKENNANSISEALDENGFTGTIFAGFDLSYKEEKYLNIGLGRRLVFLIFKCGGIYK